MTKPTQQFTDLLSPERQIGVSNRELSEEEIQASEEYNAAVNETLYGPVDRGNTPEVDLALVSEVVSPKTGEEVRESANRPGEYGAVLKGKVGSGYDERALQFSRDTDTVAKGAEDTLSKLGIEAPSVDQEEAGGRLAAARIDSDRQQRDMDPLTDRGNGVRSHELETSEKALLGGEIVDSLYGHDNSSMQDILSSFRPADAAEVARRAGEIVRKYGDAAHTPNEELAALGAYVESLNLVDATASDDEQTVQEFGKALDEIETPEDLLAAIDEERQDQDVPVEDVSYVDTYLEATKR